MVETCRCPGVVECVVDGLGQNIEAGGFFAVDQEMRLEAAGLFVAGDIRQDIQTTESIDELARPL